jgi:hypothetical protein
MGRVTGTDQHGPWTIDRTDEAINRLHPINTGEVLRSLRSKAKELTSALREALSDSDEKAKLRTATLLLLVQDDEGRAPFVAALAPRAPSLRAG